MMSQDIFTDNLLFAKSPNFHKSHDYIPKQIKPTVSEGEYESKSCVDRKEQVHGLQRGTSECHFPVPFYLEKKSLSSVILFSNTDHYGINCRSIVNHCFRDLVWLLVRKKILHMNFSKY